jgi:L-alanine-DL-glutamate epimerase-like enolase superfamily enzyme
LKTSWEFLDISKPSKIKTCYTIVLDEPKKMALDAKQHSNYPILKIKVGENNLKESMLAIREVAPNPKIILDANEDLTVRSLDKLLDFLVKMNISLIEQPVLSTEDNELEYLDTPIPLCADESFHNYDDIENIFKRYEYINIKLDKTGGLTEGLKIAKRAKELEKGIMIGCMVGSSLSMLPALMLYEYANYIDLDGPCFLKKDEDYGLIYNEGLIKLPKQVCWG